MIDMHNDLLTIAYVAYLNNNYDALINFDNMIRKGNIKGILANLYFMNEEEMITELGHNYFGTHSIIDMFKISKKVLNKYIPNIEFRYSIEGCDYLNIEDLKLLKEEGLNSIILCWNNPNKYGSGIRGDYGLTDLGKQFLIEAMNLNIGIDISHANKTTCMDILNLVQEYEYPLVYASHSNIKNLFDHIRNLDDEEIDKLAEQNGKLGLVSINYFCKDKGEYIKHIKYAVDKLGIDNVMISSDNMDFISPEFLEVKLFHYELINQELRGLLKEYFMDLDIDKILYKNALNIFRKMEG